MFTWFGGGVRWFGGGKALLLGTARMLPLALVFSAVLWAGGLHSSTFRLNVSTFRGMSRGVLVLIK